MKPKKAIEPEQLDAAMKRERAPKKAIEPEQLDAVVKRERALDELSGHGLPKAVSKNTRRRYERKLVRRARRNLPKE
jgi:beta-phosphoglucomutase-like phosphatase (HAD superfamily)